MGHTRSLLISLLLSLWNFCAICHFWNVVLVGRHCPSCTPGKSHSCFKEQLNCHYLCAALPQSTIRTSGSHLGWLCVPHTRSPAPTMAVIYYLSQLFVSTPDSLTWLYVIYSVATTPGHSAQLVPGSWLALNDVSQVKEWDWQLADTGSGHGSWPRILTTTHLATQ